jgi:Fe-S-cluster containining protein
LTRRRRADAGEPASGEAPWYADGLRFFCTACGACCTGVPGYVWVEPDDVQRMAASLGISVRRFKRLYTRKAKGRLSLRERESGDCVLLKDDRCTVYDAKPTRCSTFPFWSEVLGYPEEWKETASRCEGIDRGHLYDRAAIERLLAGDDAPMRERQARPEPEPAAGPDWDAALEDLERLYADLERELPRYQFTCAASGNCCDFDAWGHRLYVTTLEAERFFRGLERRENEDARHCPAWGPDRLCHARDGRMLGCRTFFCGPYPVAPPDDVHARYHARLVALHERHGIEYAYQDVVQWAAERRPATP